MNRKVHICTLCASSAQGAADYLERKSGIYAESLTCEDFGDVSVFAARAADLIEDGSIVVAAAPLDLFLNAKFRFLKSLSIKIVKSNSIISAMGENAPANPKESDLQAAIPHKSKVFLSQDGLYSAFAAKDDDCTVIFLPLDEDRLSYLFATGLESVFTGEEQPKAAPPVAAPAPKTKMQELRERVTGVISSGKTVAVSPCGSGKMLVSAISAVPDCEKAFVVDSACREREQDESAADYIAQCAKLSKENSGTDLGISISGIYDDNGADGSFVIVCVADSQRAKAAKVYANPGEDKKMLIVAAIIKLCQMLDELSAAGLVNPNPPVKQKKWKKNSKTPLIVAIAGIAVAIIVCVILAFVLSGNKDDASMTFAEQNGYIQQDNTLPEQTESDDEYYGGSFLGFDDDSMAVDFSPMTPSSSTSGLMTTTKLPTMRPTTTKSRTTTVTQLITAITSTTKLITTTLKPTTTTTTTKPTTTTTTTKPATTTTTAPSESSSTSGTTGTNSGNSSGKFVFRVYGWGHGVGMSQEGAIQMAKDGKTYDQILTNYFIGTTVKTDSATPLKVKYGDKEIPIVEYLCKTTHKEIGPGAPMEALKAQVVSAYTFAKYYDFDVKKSLHAYTEGFDYVGSNIHKACLAVLGMASDTDTPQAKYLDYNGSPAFTCYFASSPGKTASSDSVWGGEKYPYLVGGAPSPEEVDKTTVEISAEDMKKYIESYAKDNGYEITLGADPATWIEIVSHDGAYNESTGYVTKIRVGDKWVRKSDGKTLVNQMRGNSFRCNLLDFKIRSHCFSFEYIPA